MAAYYRAGAETRDLNIVGYEGIGATAGTVTIDTTTFRTGAAAFKFDSTGSNVAATIVTASNLGPTASGNAYWYRIYVNFSAFPGSTVTILQPNLLDAVRVRVTSGGVLQLWNASAQVGSDSAGLSLSTWYRVELAHSSVPASGSRTAELRLDGTTVAQITNGTFSAVTAAKFGWIDAPGASKVLYVDDTGNNDSNGAANTSWPGDAKVVLLVPVSDNARDTLWTGGSGGTTNLFDAVDNTPPVGTASETNTTQIEHAGGAAGTTDRYDANMTTYTNAGIATGATINVVGFCAFHGEDVATGTKLLNFEVLSNPVIASPGNATAGNDVGALGTFPSNWTNSFAVNATQAPSVTLGTSPVMRARRPETASRVASVCAMYMYVDYTPATTFAYPFNPTTVTSLYLR